MSERYPLPKKKTIIIGLILLLAIGVLASLGWAELKRTEKTKRQPQQIETQKKPQKLPEATTTPESTTTTEKEQTKEEKKLPPVKENPPYEVGDVIGYSEPGLPERYVGRVVVKAKIGEGEKEIDRYSYSIGVSNSGNIFILSREIKKYNKEGMYLSSIAFDFDCNRIYVDPILEDIYLYNSYGSGPQYRLIKHYSPDGKLIATYQASEDIDLTVGIYVESNVLYSKWDGREISKVKRMKEAEVLEKEGKIYNIPISETKKGPEDLDRINKTLKFHLTFLKKKGIEILKNKKSPLNDIITLQLPEGTFLPSFKGLDKLGNIYFLSEIYTGWPKVITLEMRKYDLSGKLLAAIKTKDGLEVVESSNPLITVIMDNNGNVYDIFETKEEYYIVKWTKEER